MSPANFKVSSTSCVVKVCDKLLSTLKEGTEVVLSAMGRDAVNQAVKAVARCNGISKNDYNINIFVDVEFTTIKKDRELSVLNFRVFTDDAYPEEGNEE